VHFIAFPISKVSIALAVVNVSRKILIPSAETIFTTKSLIVSPFSDEHVTIRPSLHPSATSFALVKISSVNCTILELLDAVTVDYIAHLSDSVGERTARDAF
jgi:hypothetical protein